MLKGSGVTSAACFLVSAHSKDGLSELSAHCNTQNHQLHMTPLCSQTQVLAKLPS